MNESAAYSVVVENLTKRFGDFVAVDDISFRVRRGEVFGFLGPNGAGKSTTIRTICGLLAPTSGAAVVNGNDVSTHADEVKSNIGYMSQRFSLYEDLTVDQNINFYGGVYGLEGSRLDARKRWVLQMAGLVGKEHALTRSLSGGWKQRLALGCAILHEPPIVFLDEPTGGVDPVSRRNFWELIYQLSHSGVTVFVTTHYMDEAEHCNTIGLIYAGRLIAIGSPIELKKKLDQFSFYEILTDHPIEAMDTLQSLPWVNETSIFGSAFHVSAKGQADLKPKIRKALEATQIETKKIERISPSLEDVFIHLIAQEDAKGATR